MTSIKNRSISYFVDFDDYKIDDDEEQKAINIYYSFAFKFGYVNDFFHTMNMTEGKLPRSKNKQNKSNDNLYENKIDEVFDNYNEQLYFTENNKYYIQLSPFIHYLESSVKKDIRGISNYRPLLLSISKQMVRLSVKVLDFYSRVFEQKTGTYDNDGINSKYLEDLFCIGYKQILNQFPVYTRILFSIIDNSLLYAKEIMCNFEKDKARLANYYDISEIQIDYIELFCGDSHNGGKSVSKLVFRNGEAIYYKPRSGNCDLAWLEFQSKLSEKKIIEPLLYPQIIDLGEYHYASSVASNTSLTDFECKECSYHLGQLLSVLYCLGSTDLHFENLLFSNTQPVIIDSETIIVPIKAELNWDYNSASEISVLSMGVLPAYVRSVKGDTLDLASITQIPGVSEYSDYIIEGFQQTSMKILEVKDWFSKAVIKCFSKSMVRYIPRPTIVYVKLLDYITSAQFLTSGAVFDAACARLMQSYLFHGDYTRKVQFLEEIKSFYNYDVPSFYALCNSRNLFSNSGMISCDFYNMAPLENVQNRIHFLSSEKLEYQAKLIRLAFSSRTHEPAYIEKGYSEVNNDVILSSVSDIKEYVLSLNYSYDLLRFVELKKIDDMKYNVVSLPINYYDGEFGIYMFLGAYAYVFHDEKLANLVKKSVVSCVDYYNESSNKIKRLGLQNGVTGIIIALKNLYVIYRDNVFLQKAKEIVYKIQSLDVSTFNSIDLMDGIAGLIHAIFDLPDLEQDEQLVLMLTRTVNSLRSKYLNSIQANQKQFNRPLTGFAHGTSGLILAFAEAYSILKNRDLLEPINALIEYEDRNFNTDNANWPDYRDNIIDQYMHGWCSGAPGIGLVRARLSKLIPSYKFPTLMFDSYLDKNISSSNDTFCCGSLSRVELLLELGRNDEAEKIVISIVKNSKPYNTPSLFKGYAGLGYMSLRVLNDSIIPSII